MDTDPLGEPKPESAACGLKSFTLPAGLTRAVAALTPPCAQSAYMDTDPLRELTPEDAARGTAAFVRCLNVCHCFS